MLGIQILTSTFKTIRNVIIPDNTTLSEAGIYIITCKICKNDYVGENSWSLKKHLYKHTFNFGKAWIHSSSPSYG